MAAATYSFSQIGTSVLKKPGRGISSTGLLQFWRDVERVSGVSWGCPAREMGAIGDFGWEVKDPSTPLRSAQDDGGTALRALRSG